MNEGDEFTTQSKPHYEDGIPIFPSSHDKAESRQRAKENEERSYKDRQISLDGRMVTFTKALFICTLLSAGISGYQAYVGNKSANAAQASAKAAETAAKTASDTLGEMQHGSGATDTHNLAEQAKRQAEQTVALSTAASRQADQTAILAANALSQAKAANTLAAQAGRSADYAQQSIQTTVEADRPWIGIIKFTVIPLLDGEESKARFQFLNTGKRPAIVRMKVATAEFTKLPLAPFAGEAALKSESLVLPGAGGTAVLPFTTSRSDTERLIRTRMSRFFLAEILYTDVQTNSVHITHYCSFYEPRREEDKFPLCPGYNDAK